MKIKTVDGTYKEVLSDYHHCSYTSMRTWVSWADIKPILEEYQSAIENESVGCSDYGLMK